MRYKKELSYYVKYTQNDNSFLELSRNIICYYSGCCSDYSSDSGYSSDCCYCSSGYCSGCYCFSDSGCCNCSDYCSSQLPPFIVYKHSLSQIWKPILKEKSKMKLPGREKIAFNSKWNFAYDGRKRDDRGRFTYTQRKN